MAFRRKAFFFFRNSPSKAAPPGRADRNPKDKARIQKNARLYVEQVELEAIKIVCQERR
jgi:hypothetical protein